MKEQKLGHVVSIDTYTELEEGRFDDVAFSDLEKVCFHGCTFSNVRFGELYDVLFVECMFTDCTFGSCAKVDFVFCVINSSTIAELDVECTFDLTTLNDVTGVRYAQYGLFLAVYQNGKLMFHRYDEESGDIEDWQANLTFMVDPDDTEAMLAIEQTRAALWHVSSII
jgi:hypothetical protein